jgi:hypothetical protein
MMSTLSATAASDLLMALLAISASEARMLAGPAALDGTASAADYAAPAADSLAVATPVPTMLIDDAANP